MGDIYYKQQLLLLAGKKSANGTSINEKYLERNPAETLEMEFDECSTNKFAIPPSSVDIPLCQGTVNDATLLVLKTTGEEKLKIKIVNSHGTTVDMEVIPERWSVLHTEFTEILATNDTTVPITGVVFIGGE